MIRTSENDCESDGDACDGEGGGAAKKVTAVAWKTVTRNGYAGKLDCVAFAVAVVLLL